MSSNNKFHSTDRRLFYFFIEVVILSLIALVGSIFYFIEVTGKQDIAGIVYHDVNANNHIDDTDLKLKDIKINLELPNGKLLETTTNQEGEYAFKGLLRYGNYNILKPLQYKIIAGKIERYTLTGSSVETIDKLTDSRYDIAYTCTCIFGFVYVDDNKNQIKEVGEKGVASVSVKLDTPWHTTQTTATDNGGLYVFYDMQQIRAEEGDNSKNYVVHIDNPTYEDINLEPGGEVSESFKFVNDFRRDFPLNPK
ncbi:MAG: SdrD B-like domain-containing protein [bacterium]|nr:SdrD B-like domain-containing protein [bacterium]